MPRPTPAASRQPVEIESLAEFDAHVARTADLRGAYVQSVDLTARSEILDALPVSGAVLLGCDLAPGVDGLLANRGALIFPDLPDLPFDPYRTTLYGAHELYASPTGRYADSADAAIYTWAKAPVTRQSVAGSLAAALHDHAITEALDDAMAPIPATEVVGVMGGHAVTRDQPGYVDAARLGWALARDGLTVLTGGGPGAMEASNLGAYLSAFDGAALAEALAVLTTGPTVADGIDPWLDAARAVLTRWPADHAGRSFGIPTWFYGHEPSNPFATSIAKYFLNPLREDTLLARCRGGIVFLPGAAGTVQEIFTATTGNYYAQSPEEIAPLVLVGGDYWRSHFPAWPLLRALGQDRAMGVRMALVETTAEAPEALTRLAARS